MLFLHFYFKKNRLKLSSFIAHRIAFNRNYSFSKFIIRLSVAATAISVAAMLITLAFANGFQQKVSEKVFNFWGHARIQQAAPYTSINSGESPINASPTLVAEMKNRPNIKDVYPYATRYAILKTKDDLQGILLKGIDSSYSFDRLKEFMVEGNAVGFNDSTYSRDIMISHKTAQELKLKLNDRVMFYFIKSDGSIRPDRLTVKGIFKTGIAEFDNSFSMGDIQLIRRLNGWKNSQIGGYEIVLNDHKQVDTVINQLPNLKGFGQTWIVENIRDYVPNIFDWLNMQDTTRNVLIGIMIIVALINMVTCLIILVLERIRMVGVLKAIGASNWMIQKIFIRHGLLIALKGILIGAAIGLGVLYVQVKTGFIKLDEDAYLMPTAAVKISVAEVLVICGATLVICMLVLLIPSLIVKRLSPVMAIRFK